MKRNARGTRAGADDKAVLNRAKRLLRAYIRDQLAPVLGLAGEDITEEKVVVALKAAQDRIKEIEAGNTPDLVKEVDRLKAENLQLKKKAVKAIRVAKAKEQEAKDRDVEFEIREAAMTAGVKDVDYGIHLFRSHVVGLAEGSPEPEPKKFFEGLRTDEGKRYLFDAGTTLAGTRTIAEENRTQQTQQTSTQPPNQTPSQAPNQSTPPAEEVDASKLSTADFRAHLRNKYKVGNVASSVS